MSRDTLNVIIASIVSVVIFITWQYFIATNDIVNVSSVKANLAEEYKTVSILTREEVFNKTQRTGIQNKHIKGSIVLQGARIDDAQLLDYRVDVSDNSPNVCLLSPAETSSGYFVELGWNSDKDDLNIILPNSSTVWSIKDGVNGDTKNKELFWINDQGVKFILKFAIDEDYMMRVTQTIENLTDNDFFVRPYVLINRKLSGIHDLNLSNSAMLHQGGIGVISDTLEEFPYEKLKSENIKSFEGEKLSWAGITDKYWLVAFIPVNNINYYTNFQYDKASERFQVSALEEKRTVAARGSLSNEYLVFIGPKKVNLLENYQNTYNIKLFDRAIDFGRLYILTKPIFHILNFLYKMCGNFGVSIILLTILMKFSMFWVTKSSFISMKKLRGLQPKIQSLKENFSGDKVLLNQKLLELYKTEKINPASGCLPMVIQIPIFFAVYKVLYVTIEMRHAPFFGWIHDLSSEDPLSIFNLFGLLSFNLPDFLHIGIWPILMSFTMFFQQKFSPAPADPVQAKVMKMLPFIFLFMFSKFPAGLLIYWTCSNLISCLQQYYINKNFS